MNLGPMTRFALMSVLAGTLGCSETTAPLPPPDEVLLVVNSTESSLSIVPVESPASAVDFPLGGTTPTPVGVAARDAIAIVPMGLDNSVVVVDLRTPKILRTIHLPAGSGATGVAIVDDSIAYVANPNLNSVTRINYLTGDTASVAVGVAANSFGWGGRSTVSAFPRIVDAPRAATAATAASSSAPSGGRTTAVGGSMPRVSCTISRPAACWVSPMAIRNSGKGTRI